MIMKAKIYLSICMSVLVLAISYFLGAFISWSPDMSGWTDAGRFSLVWCWLFGSALATFGVFKYDPKS